MALQIFVVGARRRRSFSAIIFVKEVFVVKSLVLTRHGSKARLALDVLQLGWRCICHLANPQAITRTVRKQEANKMKTKTSSKKVPTPFSRRIALLGCALLALTIFAPAVAEALQLGLDSPFQSVAAPPSGTTIVDFTGTVILFPDYHLTNVFLDSPSNLSDTIRLNATVTPAFLTFFNTAVGPATFTGSIFDVEVPAGTPPDIYAFGLVPFSSEIALEATGADFLFEFRPFGVVVTGVPDRGSSILLLGLSLAVLCGVQRAFVSRAKRAAA
jgi:hypothetical protein